MSAENDNPTVNRAWILTELKSLYQNAAESSVKLKCLELLLENAPAETRKSGGGILAEARAKSRE